MILIDTSILIPVFRDKSGRRREIFRDFLRGRTYLITRFTQLELLQGCMTEAHWGKFSDYLDAQDYVEMSADTWGDAARMFFDLRRKGKTVRTIIDCCIAQLAIENRLLLVHNDNDFEVIELARKVKLHRLDIQ